MLRERVGSSHDLHVSALTALALAVPLLCCSCESVRLTARPPKKQQVKHVLDFLHMADEENRNAVAALEDKSVFHDEDLRSPTISPAEEALSQLNIAMLDYNGNWGVRQHDSIIMECGHSAGQYGNRTYFDQYIGGKDNHAQGNLDEWRCPLRCFKKERRLTHNAIFQELAGEPLHPTCTHEACPVHEACGRSDGSAFMRQNEAPRRPCGETDEKPRAVFMIGVPAVGKDRLLRGLAESLFHGSFAVVDPDDITARLVNSGQDAPARLVRAIMEGAKVADSRPFVVQNYDITQILAQHVHRESIVLSYHMTQRFMSDCRGFVVQKTGTRWSVLKPLVMEAKARGYEVQVLIAHAHPFNIWLNHLHRVKHFLSAGRAMQREQIINDSGNFPGALAEMLNDYLQDGVQIDGMAMYVYGDMMQVIHRSDASLDLFSHTGGVDELLSLWNPFNASMRSSSRRVITEELVARRSEYASELLAAEK